MPRIPTPQAGRSFLLVLLLLSLGGRALADTAADLERAVALFQTGEYAAAARLLERVRAAEPADLDTALLLGIAYFKLDRLERAAPLLQAASASPDAETASSARLFLGLSAALRGDQDRARARFAEVAASGVPGLAAQARSLLPRRTSLSLYLLVRPEVDSNVPLAGAALIAQGGQRTADAGVLVLGSLEGCLGLTDRACLADTPWVRKQAELAAYDMVANVTSASYRHVGTQTQLALRYAFEVARRGGAPYELGHAAGGSLRHGRLALGARFAYRRYDPADYAPLTGPSVEIHAGVRLAGEHHDLELAATTLREWASRSDLSALGGGLRADGRLSLFGPFEAQVAAAVVGRRFDEGRRDIQARGEVTLVLALPEGVSVLAGVAALTNRSNDTDYQLDKVTAYLGLDMAYP